MYFLFIISVILLNNPVRCAIVLILHMLRSERLKNLPSRTAREKEIQELNAVLFDFLTKVLINVGERVRLEEAEVAETRMQAMGLRTSLSGFRPYEPLSLNQGLC